MPPTDPYPLNFAAFTEFEFVSIPALFCLEPWDVRRMFVTHESTGVYKVELTHVQQRYCSNTDTLLTVTVPSRQLTAAEITDVLTVCSRVEIQRAMPDSCLAWNPIRSCSARWDQFAYNRQCTIDHLSDTTVGRLFALVDSLDTVTKHREETKRD